MDNNLLTILWFGSGLLTYPFAIHNCYKRKLPFYRYLISLVVIPFGFLSLASLIIAKVIESDVEKNNKKIEKFMIKNG